MLQLGNRFRRPHVLLAARAILVFAAGIERVTQHRVVAERELMHPKSLLGDLEQAQKLDPSNQETFRLMALAKAKVDERIAKARAQEIAPETATLHLPDTTPLAPVATDLSAVQPQPAAPQPTVPPPAAPAPIQPAVPAANASEFHARGRKLLQEERFAEAIQQLTEAVRLDPALALAYNARGYAYYRLKQYPQAMADFDRAISLNPGYANAYQNRSAARGATGDKAGSVADQAKARELTRTPANH